MKSLKYLVIILLSVSIYSCSGDSTKIAKTDTNKVQAFLDTYNSMYQQLLKIANEAEWHLNTRIVKGDSLTGLAAEKANEAMANFTGSKTNTKKATSFLKDKASLTPIQVKQLEVILYKAGSNPEAAGNIVQQKIAADTKQTEDLFGYDYQINGETVSTNDIDGILKSSEDINERLIAWEASKAIGGTLKGGLNNLRGLRNQSVQALGYTDYFSYQVSEYGMTSQEMVKQCRDLVKEVWPLYRELHTWARHTLAEKYKQDVPEMLPAHWLPNRWGQDWTGLVNVEGYSLNDALGKKDAEWIVRKGEEFYVSLGFDKLPSTFYERSSLYPLPEGADYKKNNHASAWHMNNDNDVRSLMSVEPNTEWWETTLHELGHIYYFMTYSNDNVPIILREGANRAYHEAMGSLIGLASMQEPFLNEMGLIGANAKADPTQVLLKEALNYIVLIPWGAGVMTEFENELYANDLPVDQYNAKWWEAKKNIQGIVPPTERGEEFCDAATKTHINNDAAQYYDYALSTVLLFQFHDHIAKNILKEDPHYTNYYGDKHVGEFFKELMRPGATADWNQLLIDQLGSPMSAKAMMDYFAPLTKYLAKENKGRRHTLPETPIF